MKIYTPFILFVFCLSFAITFPSQLFADGGGGVAVQRTDPNFNRGQKAIEGKDWNKAVEYLLAASRYDPRDADTFNLLGYAERMRGNLEMAFTHYDKALALDPDHRGAHEYIGEAYLKANNLPKAEEHLARLDKLCFFPCGEYTDLKEAIAEYKNRQGK